MPTVERIETWRGQDVLDGTGGKAGRLEEVYYETAKDEPVLISVKRGLLGRQLVLVPVGEAVLSHDYVTVPYTPEQLEQAQSVSAEDELSSEQVAAVGTLYSVPLTSTGPVFSASLIERRQVEAEKADARARELQHEAQEREEELERARRRAEAVAEEARAADREREKAQTAAEEAGHLPA